MPVSLISSRNEPYQVQKLLETKAAAVVSDHSNLEWALLLDSKGQYKQKADGVRVLGKAHQSSINKEAIRVIINTDVHRGWSAWLYPISTSDTKIIDRIVAKHEKTGEADEQRPAERQTNQETTTKTRGKPTTGQRLRVRVTEIGTFRLTVETEDHHKGFITVSDLCQSQNLQYDLNILNQYHIGQYLNVYVTGENNKQELTMVINLDSQNFSWHPDAHGNLSLSGFLSGPNSISRAKKFGDWIVEYLFDNKSKEAVVGDLLPYLDKRLSDAVLSETGRPGKVNRNAIGIVINQLTKPPFEYFKYLVHDNDHKVIGITNSGIKELEAEDYFADIDKPAEPNLPKSEPIIQQPVLQQPTIVNLNTDNSNVNDLIKYFNNLAKLKHVESELRRLEEERNELQLWLEPRHATMKPRLNAFLQKD